MNFLKKFLASLKDKKDRKPSYWERRAAKSTRSKKRAAARAKRKKTPHIPWAERMLVTSQEYKARQVNTRRRNKRLSEVERLNR